MSLIGGEQINRRWTTLGVGAVGLVVAVTGAAYLLRPAYRVTHPVTGGVAFEVLNRGSAYFSGGVMINLGGAGGTGTTVDTGVALEVIGTASGRNLFASRSITGTNLVAAMRFSGAGLSDCDTASSKLLWDAATKRFSCGSDIGGGFGTGNVLTIGDARYVNQSGDTMTGTLILNPQSGLALNARGTVSGSNLTISRSGSFSGTLLVKTSITSKGSLSGVTIGGFSLGSCNGSTQKLLYNNSTQKFECGSDQTGTSIPFGTGNVLTIGDARYLKRSGGTMTGQLIVNITGGNFNTVGLKIINTLSGAHLHAEKTLTSSGSITAEGTISGSLLIGRTLSGTFVNSGRFSVSPVTLQFATSGTGTSMTTGSGRILYVIPKTMSGFKIYDAQAFVATAGTTNSSTVQIRNASKGNCKVFSTPLTIDTGEKNSDDSSTPFVLNSSCNTVGGGDYLYTDFPAVSTTAPKGNNNILYFYKP